MKKLLAILCVVTMIFCFVGCAPKDDAVVKNIEKCGFIVIDRIGRYGDISMYRVYNAETKVEYIYVRGAYESSLCPNFDENGDVIIYKGE